MHNLVLHRVIASLGALIGLLPVTLLFVWGTWQVFFETLYRARTDSSTFMIVLGVMAVSIFCLGCGWWIYAQAMREQPRLRHHPVLLLGLVIGVLWGIGWACIWDLEFRPSSLVFLLPGVTMGATYFMTWRREHQRCRR